MNEQPVKNSLKKDAAFVYGGYFLRYLSVLVLIPYYGRVLGPANYGKILAAMSLMSIIWMAVNYGFSTTGARELAKEKDENLWGTIFGRQITARLLLVPAGIIIGIAGTLLSPVLSENPWYGVAATVLGLFNAMNLGWFFQGLRKFRTSIAIEALAYPLNVVFILFLVRNEGDGLYAMIGLLMSSFITTVVAYVTAIKLLRGKKVIFRDGIEEIKSASVIFLQAINSMLMTSGSTYLLSVLSTPEQVGYFGSVERIVSFGLSFLGPMGQVLMPTIAYRTANEPERVQGLVRKGLIFEFGYGLCACLGCVILAPYIIPFVFGSKFGPSVLIMEIMVFALPFAAFTHAFGLYVLIPHKKEKRLVLTVAAGNIVNLLLVFVFAHSLGGLGVASARVAGEIVIALLLVYFSFRSKSTNILFSKRLEKL